MYVDDDFIEEMDGDDQGGDGESDFKTIKESDIAEDEHFDEGDIMDINKQLQNDSLCQLSLIHQEHVYCVA